MTTTPFMPHNDKIAMFKVIETETKAVKRQAESFRAQNYISLLEDRIKSLESIQKMHENTIAILKRNTTLI